MHARGFLPYSTEGFERISAAYERAHIFWPRSYHPSLLPLHRGRDAVRWAVRMGDRVTGGTVYRLANKMDGGNVLLQRHVLVYPGESAEDLWRRALGPLGVALLVEAVRLYAEHGYQHGTPQDEALATWEPSIDRPPAFRPELELIGWDGVA